MRLFRLIVSFRDVQLTSFRENVGCGLFISKIVLYIEHLKRKIRIHVGQPMRYLPIYMDVKDAVIAIIGEGRAAEAKLRTLVKTDANLHVYAANPSDEILKWQDEGRITVFPDFATEDQLKMAALIYAASEDDNLNSDIAKIARLLNIPVNTADAPLLCDFITPAMIDRDPVVVTIGTEGTSPSLARALKGHLEHILPSDTGDKAIVFNRLRKDVAKLLPRIEDRQKFWLKILGSADLPAILSRSPEQLEAQVSSLLSQNDEIAIGRVALVGAGPGDPELLTLKAHRLLSEADVVVYDRLVASDILDMGRREAEYIYVGKEPGGQSVSQDDINTILVKKALSGLHVIRLKSGDPLIFGRAEDEMQALDDAGVTFEIVPGITSAASAAAAIGASLTVRGENKAVSFLTGHDAKGFAEQDWRSLAQPGSRAAVYMGVGAARFIQGRLMVHGADNSMPVTIVENASRATEIIITTHLSDLSSAIEREGIKGPAILLLGYAMRDRKDAVIAARKEAV